MCAQITYLFFIVFVQAQITDRYLERLLILNGWLLLTIAKPASNEAGQDSW